MQAISRGRRFARAALAATRAEAAEGGETAAFGLRAGWPIRLAKSQDIDRHVAIRTA